MSVRFRQPQAGAQINWSNTFTRGLVWASIGDGPNIIKPNAFPVLAGAYTKTVSTAGRCVKAPSAQSAGTATWSASLSIPASSDYAIAIFAKPSTDTGGITTHAFPGTNINEFALSASGFTALIDNNTSNTASYAGTKPELFMASRIDNQAYVYVPNGTTSNSITGTRAQSITSVVAGRPSGNNFVNTETYLILIFTRSFSVGEYKEFAKNPWQIFKPSQSITTLFTPTGGPAQYTLTAQGGSYTKTGASTTLLKSKLISAQGGSYANTGASATLKYNRLISAQGGSYLKSGADAVMLRHKSLSVQGGSYAKTGANANITYTGLANSYTLTCQGGVYVKSGANATLLKSKKLTCQGGAYTFTGRTAVITYSGAPVIPPGVRSYLDLDSGDVLNLWPLN